MFKPGQSGNPEGTKPNKPFVDAVKRAIAQSDGEKLRKCAEKLLQAGADGQPWAVQLLFERLDGSVTQGIDVRSTSTVTIAISETDGMVAEALAARADSASPQSLPH